jgi:hypothetical protein
MSISRLTSALPVSCLLVRSLPSFSSPRPSGLLGGIPLDPEPVHEILERRPVLLDLQDQARERGPERRSLVLGTKLLRDLHAGYRTAQMIVEVDPQEIDGNHGAPLAEPIRPGP